MKIRTIAIVGILASGLAACQTAEQSLYSAQSVCDQTGLRPGTARYQRCVAAGYQQNRAQSEQAAATAVAVGAVGALAGAAIAADSGPRYYYGRPYRYRHYGYCGRWGC